MLHGHPRCILVASCLLAFACAVSPTPGLAKDESVLAQLVRLEHAAWNAWRSRDSSRFRSLLMPDHVAVDAHGVSDREQVASAISDPACQVRSFSLGEFELRQPTPDIALLVFRARQDATCGGVQEPRELRSTSLYVRTEDQWRSLFHQSTPQIGTESPRETGSMDARISIITLGVEDLERSIVFYRDGLGLPQRESPSDIAFFHTRGTWLSLYARKKLAEDVQVDPGASGFRDFTLAHNVKSREEVDALIHDAEKAGAHVLKRPQDVSWGGYSGYFQDPDGFVWEVAWNPHMSIE